MPQEMGLVASSRRNIRSGKEWEALFSGMGEANGKTVTVKNGADVFDTLEHIKQIVRRDYNTTSKVAAKLLRSNVNETLKAVFDFMYWHYQYKIDTPGKEQLRTPLRAFKDRHTGIDCDCYSISVSSILVAMIKSGYKMQPPVLRIIKLYNRPYYQHIYVIIPKYKGADLTVRSNYWVIDPVLDQYDKEAPFTAKYDTPVMELQELSGINAPNTDIGQEFEGFGHTCDGTIDTYNARVYNHIANTRNAIAISPKKVQGWYKPQAFVNVADTVLRNWHNENTRTAALAWASNMEMGLVDDNMEGLQGLMHDDAHDLYTHLNGDVEFLEAITGFDLSGLGATKKGTIKQKIAAVKAKVAPIAAKANENKKGIFTKIKNAEKIVKATANKATKKVNVATVKQVVKAVQKVNPVAVAIRNAFLAAMNLNVGHYSEKLKYAYGSQSAAEQAGYNWRDLQAAKAEVEKMFVNIAGGNATALRNAIVNHKHILHPGVKGLDEMEGLGIVGATVAATSTAAATPFLAKVAQILSKFKLNKEQKDKLKKFGKKAQDFAKNHEQDIVDKAKGMRFGKKNNAAKQNPASDEEQTIVTNSSSPADTSQTTDPQKGTPGNDSPSPGDDPKPEKKGSMMLWLGAAAVAAVAIAASSSSSESKPVSGIDKKKVTRITL